MAQKKLDISVLRGALGVFITCLTIAGVMLSASFYFREKMSSEYLDHQARFRDISRKYLSVDEEESIIGEYLPQFRALYDDGILGQEQRLSWLETLKAAGEEIKPPKLAYEIRAQSVYEPDFALNTGGFDINVTDMDLSLGLLHEGDLFDVLDILDKKAAGLFSVSFCELSRSARVSREDALPENIEANCQLKWFTIDLKGERELTL